MTTKTYKQIHIHIHIHIHKHIRINIGKIKQALIRINKYNKRVF